MVAGYDIRKVQNERFNKIGVSFEQSNVYGKLTARENLEYYAKLFDVPTRDPMELLRLVGLDGKENVRASEFSKGMKHRLTFARSLVLRLPKKACSINDFLFRRCGFVKNPSCPLYQVIITSFFRVVLLFFGPVPRRLTG